MDNMRDVIFACKVRRALNERLDMLPTSTVNHLASARNIAISRKKNDTPIRVLATRRALAGLAGNFGDAPLSWMGIGLAIAVVVLVGGLVGIFQFERQQHITEMAVIDAALLTDDLPLIAYTDRGFNAYLVRRTE